MPFLMEKYSLYNYTHTHLGLSFILHWEKSSKLTKTFLSAIGQINIYHFWRQAYMKLVQCCLEWSDDKSMTTWQHFKIYWCGGTLNENISYKNSPSINIKKTKNQTYHCLHTDQNRASWSTRYVPCKNTIEFVIG